MTERLSDAYRFAAAEIGRIRRDISRHCKAPKRPADVEWCRRLEARAAELEREVAGS